jgi:hypothetical protein
MTRARAGRRTRPRNGETHAALPIARARIVTRQRAWTAAAGRREQATEDVSNSGRDSMVGPERCGSRGINLRY